jgi:hypothetical protein
MWLTGRALFSLLIALLMAYMVVASFDYGFRARVFPATLGSLIFFMALLQFLGDAFPAVQKKLPFLGAKGIALEGSAASHAPKDTQVRAEHERKPSWLPIYGIFAALVAFAVLLHFTSFLVAVPAFLFLFAWLVAKERLIPALGLAAGVTIFMYLIFRVILGSQF